MESTTPKTNQGAQAGFVPVKNITDNLDDVAVGHAGVYPIDKDDAVDTNVVSACIPLGEKAGKVLIDCEKHIKLFVKDVLANKLEGPTVDKEGNEKHFLSKYGLLPEDVAHLPKSETGVWIYYLTKGIAKDFGLTWETTPVSLKEKATIDEKKYQKGIRPSKKEKNDTLAKQDLKYWRPFIESGAVTKEQAYEEMDAAYAKQLKWEKLGYYISPNKTQGVALFDWKSEVKRKYGDDDSALKIYNRHSIIPLIPCLEDKLNSTIMNPKVKKELDKSIVAGITFVNTNDFMKETISEWDNMRKHYEPRTLHIAKINQSGKMRDRWFVVDAIRIKDKAQVLLMWDKNGVDGILE